jgi:hypothetical protein
LARLIVSKTGRLLEEVYFFFSATFVGTIFRADKYISRVMLETRREKHGCGRVKCPFSTKIETFLQILAALPSMKIYLTMLHPAYGVYE